MNEVENNVFTLNENRSQVWDLLVFRIVFIGIIMFISGFVIHNIYVIATGFTMSLILIPYSFYCIFKHNRTMYNYRWKEVFSLPILPNK